MSRGRLRSTSSGVAGGFWNSGIPWLYPAMAADEIGFGIIGAGNIAGPARRRPSPAIPGARVRAVLGKPARRAEAWPRKFGADALIDADRFFARPDIQVVTICTPSGTHAELGDAAAAAGKHVWSRSPST